jgi:hypothetical protein
MCVGRPTHLRDLMSVLDHRCDLVGCFLNPFSLAIGCVNFSDALEYADRDNLVRVDEDSPYFFARFVRLPKLY